MPDFDSGVGRPSDGLPSEAPGWLVAIASRKLRDTGRLARLLAGEWEPPCEPDCSGFIAVEDGEGPLWGECPRAWNWIGCALPLREEKDLRSDMERYGWPKLYVEECRWDLCRVQMQAREWVKGRRPQEGLILHGPVGTGKTMTMCLLAKSLWRQGIVCRFQSWPELVARLGASGEKGEFLDRLMVAPMLCVDDVGVGDIAPWAFGLLDWLFEKRNGMNRPNMATTNSTLDTLRKDPEWGRFVDRWRESMKQMAVPGTSQRVNA